MTTTKENTQNGSFRAKKTYYSQVSNTALRDKSLSLKAKGLYSLIQSYITIENFTLYKDMLVRESTDGKTAFQSAWNELKEKGYLVQYRTNTGKGWIYEYDLLDIPVNTLPIHGKPTHGEDGVYNKTKINNTDLNNTKNNKKGAILSEVAPCVFLFFTLYGEWFKVEHPHIKIEQIERAEDSISSFLEEICLEGDLEALEDMITKYFHATFSSGTDYSINHFANHEVMLHRAQECGYVTME